MFNERYSLSDTFTSSREDLNKHQSVSKLILDFEELTKEATMTALSLTCVYLHVPAPVIDA